ncbi:bem46 protein, variant [Datura stramonium]|uniref:Bem46 protein, variant n=1 Tax=Datura stramonium TaxID=4076 RepID=A0ABS8V6Z7_DATST|nr:bem46 protein, variant [Datura stramonium]
MVLAIEKEAAQGENHWETAPTGTLERVAGLILENTFTSILDMAGVLLPFLKWVIGGSGSKGFKLLNFVVRSPWNTIDVIGEIRQPILFLSGLQDEMVPPFHMQMLYAKAAARNRQCLFVEFPNGMHMDTWLAGGDHYWRTIQKYLEETVPEKKDDESKKDKELSSKQNASSDFAAS